jgi:hypothetical protein
MALIRQGQGNSPAVLEGRLGVGDWLLPNAMVAIRSYQSISVGCDDLYAHFAPNRGGLLGYFAGPEKPPNTMWLKPGVEAPGFPSVAKEGLYEADGSVWEHGIYWHQLVIAIGRPSIRLEQPICGTLIFKSKQFSAARTFYHTKLKTITAVIDGKHARHKCVGLWEVGSEIVPGRNNWKWVAPTMTLLSVAGQPGGPSIELSWIAKTLRDNLKQGRAWASEPLPAIAAELVTSKADIRVEPDASKSDPSQIPASKPRTAKSDIGSKPGASTSHPPPIPPDGYADDAGGPRSLDDVLFD